MSGEQAKVSFAARIQKYDENGRLMEDTGFNPDGQVGTVGKVINLSEILKEMKKNGK